MNATLHRSAMTPQREKPVPAAGARLGPNGGRMRLPEGHYVRTEDARGWTVRALAGTVWVTQDWDSRDIVLNAGEQFVLDRKGAALLWPLGDTVICIAQDRLRCAKSAVEETAAPATAPTFA